MGEVSGLVILTDQLVGAVVDIAGGAGAVVDRQDIPIVIVGVDIGPVHRAGDVMDAHLSAGGSGCGIK